MTLASNQNLFLQPGQIIEHRRQRYAVVQCLDVDTILIRHLITGTVERVSYGMITPASDAHAPPTAPLPDLLSVPDDDWKTAQQRFEAIQPLLELHPYQRTRQAVEERAQQFELHPSTLYRWMALYQESKKVSSLMPQDRKDKGTHKLGAAVEAVVQEVIETFYLTTQRRSIQSTCLEVMRRCKEGELEAPHYNTVRNRVLERTQYLRVAKRLGPKAAQAKLRPDTGSFPGADYPLAVVQIDHTQLDIVLVDDHHREPLGRPWITLALDVRTRLVAGYALSFDEPSALSVGLCLINTILPKTWLLTEFGMDARWPIQGLPHTIHMDNAKEFHGLMLERACQQYGIQIDYRPKGVPQMGGHVERMMDSLATLIHELPGTTFHNPKDRGEYPSSAKAVFTFKEFERVLLTQITRVYHERYHQGLQTTPLKRFELDVLGTSERPGTGLMVADVDAQRLRYDFLPYFEHTVQNYGILHKHLHYYADVLKPWIDAPDPQHSTQKRKFISRYDPRDMSEVYFYDPELNQHFRIPFRDSTRPAQVSLWELRAATKRVREAGLEAVDEDTIFAALEDIQRMTDAARKTTKKQRRVLHRKEHHTPVHQAAGTPAAPSTQEPVSAARVRTAPSTATPVQTSLTLAGFEDIEVDF